MKACFFDIDGTLIVTGGAGQVAFAETFADEFGIDRITDDISFAGRSDRAIATDLFRFHGVPVTDETWRRFQAGYLPRLDDALQKCPGEVLPGVEDAIRGLEQRGDVLLGLLTGNVVRAAEKKLCHYGLWARFTDAADTLPHTPPSGAAVVGGFGDHHSDRNDIAATAAQQARHAVRGSGGATPAEGDLLVVIGDTPNDIRCGRSIGAKVVAVPTGHTPAEELARHEPDLLVETLQDADELLAWFE